MMLGTILSLPDPHLTPPLPSLFLLHHLKVFFSSFANFLLFLAVDEALCHPYLAPLHDINEEPVCPRPFSFDFEQPSFTEENIKELIYRESVKFNPDPIH